MDRNIVAKVKEVEKDEMFELFERLNSQKSLLLTLTQSTLNIDKNNWLYEKLKNDFQVTMDSYNSWWDKICEKHNIVEDRSKLMIDFKDCCIYLLE